MNILLSQMPFNNVINALSPKISSSLFSLRKVAVIVGPIALVVIIYKVCKYITINNIKIEKKEVFKEPEKTGSFKEVLDDLKTFEHIIPKNKYEHTHSTIVSLFTIKENFESIKMHILNGDYFRWNHHNYIININGLLLHYENGAEVLISNLEEILQLLDKQYHHQKSLGNLEVFFNEAFNPVDCCFEARARTLNIFRIL